MNILIIIIFFVLLRFALSLKLIRFWLFSLFVLLFLSGICIIIIYRSSIVYGEPYQRVEGLFNWTPIAIALTILFRHYYTSEFSYYLVCQLFYKPWFSLFMLILTFLFIIIAGVIKIIEIFKGNLRVKIFRKIS